uniref:Uncharacterized protein n=1 Tax=viral metagenome TaxID=1070528 RepID=A0A6C0D1N8_9ZZZZ
MSKRTISINPQFFNISKKKNKKIIPSQVNINASNIRQLLLDKLKEHKKTRKIITEPKSITPLQEKSFDENSKKEEKEVEKEIEKKKEIEKEVEKEIEKKIEKEIEKDNSKPYGNLKNGIKPTYRMYQQDVQKPNDEIPVEPKIILEEKEVKKTFKLGKNPNTRTISILIKNNKSRKKVEDKKTEHKKTAVSTIKNYLKKKNLIKYGSTAPTKLLREMYETSELCGGISNENKDVLIHNFDK